MWKMITGQIRECIYYSVISCGLFPNEAKKKSSYAMDWLKIA